MNIKQKLQIIVAGFFIMVVTCAFTMTLQASAAPGNNGCETDTAIIKCDNVTVGKDGVENTGVWSILLTVINLLTAGIAIVAIGGIIYGAVLYTSAGSSQEQVKKSMDIIKNVVIGIVAYALMYSGLNFLIPGGLFT